MSCTVLPGALRAAVTKAEDEGEAVKDGTTSDVRVENYKVNYRVVGCTIEHETVWVAERMACAGVLHGIFWSVNVSFWKAIFPGYLVATSCKVVKANKLCKDFDCS